MIAIAVPRADGTLVIEAAEGERAEEIVGLELEPAGSKSGLVLERRRSERVDSLLDDPEVDYGVGRPTGARTGLYVPLIVRDRPIGVIVAHDKSGDDPRFTSEDLRLAETFATRAAVAVDQSRRVATDALRRVVEAQELERRRLARELHDQTGQELTSVLLGLKALEDAPRAARLARRHSGRCVGRCSRRCTPCGAWRPSCDRRPSTTTVSCPRSSVCRRASSSRPASCSISKRASASARFPSDVETALYRMIQEALTNVVKHAQARHVSIVLSADRSRDHGADRG